MLKYKSPCTNWDFIFFRETAQRGTQKPECHNINPENEFKSLNETNTSLKKLRAEYVGVSIKLAGKAEIFIESQIKMKKIMRIRPIWNWPAYIT